MMAIKREAAFHEAGHSVIAYSARFHRIVSAINLEDYGAGEVLVSLSQEKCVAEGLTPTQEIARNADVAKDLGLILVAGLVAEQIAAERDATLTPNPSCSAPDHELLRQILGNAGLSRKFDQLEAQARQILEANWPAVESLASYLYEHARADPSVIEAILRPILR